jgi:hypothetical protein
MRRVVCLEWKGILTLDNLQNLQFMYMEDYVFSLFLNLHATILLPDSVFYFPDFQEWGGYLCPDFFKSL